MSSYAETNSGIDMRWNRVALDGLEEPAWRTALTDELRRIGAKPLCRAESGEVHFGWYRVGFSHSLWSGISGPASFFADLNAS